MGLESVTSTLGGSGDLGETRRVLRDSSARAQAVKPDSGPLVCFNYMNGQEWYGANRANWDERVPIHLKSYSLEAIRGGHGKLHTIEENELQLRPGERVLHLQCHFGRDSLTLAQRGAYVVGVDFSLPAVQVQETLPEPRAFDLVYVSWGAINWLPDIRAWAKIVSYYLRPGGRLYMAEGHPTASVFEDANPPKVGEMPTWFAPYFDEQPSVIDDSRDYSDPNAALENTRTYEWIDPLGSIVEALLDAGMSLEFLREHDALPWRMFAQLVEGEDGMFRWPNRRWLPLSFSLSATKQHT
jgi:SAM-dependent methyltransferase